MARHANMRTWRERVPEDAAPLAHVILQSLTLFRGENREPRQRIALMAADSWRNAPDTATVAAELGDLFRGEFNEAVRWVRAHRLNRMARASLEPLEAIGVHQRVGTRAHIFNYS